MDKKIIIVSIEGLNRSGKTTHSELLKERLRQEGIFSEILIGDGSRPGKESKEFYDPFSPFWQQIGTLIYNLDDNNNYSKYLWSQAAAVLNKELFDYRYKYLPNFLQKSKEYDVGVIITIRSPISRLFVLRQHKISVKYEEVNSKHIIEPDLITVLSCPKDILLDRNELVKDNKSDFRRHIVSYYYSLYFNTLNTLPIDVKDKIELVDSTNSIKLVHDKIYKSVKERIQLD